MKVVAAYLLAVLGGSTCPTNDDIKNILGSGTIFLVSFLVCLNICFVVDYNAMLKFCTF